MAMLASAVLREKSPEAFRTISEVALELDMPQHVLRHVELEGDFADRAEGYYRPEDVDLLRGIRTLLYREGFTIKGAQKVMRDRGQRYVAELGRAAYASSAPPSNIVVFENPREDDAPREIEFETPADDEPRYARAAQAMVERAHGEMTSASLAQEERAKLEALLGELLDMKSRLHAAH